jgi:gliding motility-associated-like protein/uncharacterized repeat protein (TIGR01451 family)
MKVKIEKVMALHNAKSALKVGFLVFFLLFSLIGYSQVISITANDAVGAETAGAPNTASFTVSRTGSPVNDTTVNYSVTGKAIEGTDYDTLSGSVVLSTVTGNTADIDITGIIDDDIVEGPEDVIITLTTEVGPGNIGANDTASITIDDNDTGVIYMDTVIPQFIDEAIEGGTFGNFWIRMRDGQGKGEGVPLNVSFTITGSDNFSNPDDDFELTSAAVNAEQTMIIYPEVYTHTRRVDVVALGDFANEVDETVTMTLTGVDNPLFSIDPMNNTATVTIINSPCPGGSPAPELNTATAIEYCDAASVNLNTFVVGGAASAPQGSSLRWSLVEDPTMPSQLLASAIVTSSGTYYGVYWADDDSCSSLSLQVDLVMSNTANPGNPVANLSRCNEAGNGVPTAINLNNAISGEDTGGTWTYVSGGTGDPGINVNDVVNFNGDPAGEYVFEYTVDSDAPCLPASTQVSITVTGCSTACPAGTDAPALNTATATEYCDVANVNLNTFVVGGAASAPDDSALRWSLISNPTLPSELLPNALVTDSNTYYGLYWADDDSCSSASLQVDLVISTSPDSGTAVANLTRCNEAGFNTPTTIDLDNAITGEDTGGTWAYVSGGTGDPGINANNVVDFVGEPADDYVFKYTVGATPPCVASETEVTITVAGCDPCTAGSNAPELAADAPATVYCVDTENNEVITIDLDDMTNSVPPNGSELRWSTLANVSNQNAHLSSSIINITNGGIYYGFFWDDVNECASEALPISISIRPIPTLTVGEDQSRCGPGEVTFTASAMADGANATINWFATPMSTSLVASGQSFSPTITETTTFYVEATLNGCTTEPRIPIVGTVVPQPSSGTPVNDGGNASACSVPSNGPTIIDLDDLIVDEDPGNWVFTSGPQGENITLPANNIVNFEDRSDGAYVFTYTTDGAQSPCTNTSTVITISVNDCDVDSDGDGLLDGLEATLGTNPNNTDSDDDGLSDAEEVGNDTDNPLNEDGDDFIDALDSNLVDSDNDGVVDQLDPANANPCLPERLNGVCDFDGDGVPDGDEFADGTDPDDPCDPNPENGACGLEVDLEVLKSVDNLNAQVGDSIVFTITVNNLSSGTASDVIVGDFLENGFEYVSDIASAGTYDEVTGEWTIPSIAGSESAALNITVNVVDGGDDYSNTAELLSVFQEDTNAENNISETITLQIELPDDIDLALTKKAISENPLVGDDVKFILTLTNESVSEATVNTIEVRDLITSDSGFVYKSSNPSIGSTYDENTGIWLVERLEKGEETTLEIIVHVPNEGRFTNTASIERSSPGDGNTDNNTDSVEVNVSGPNPVEVGFMYNQFSPNGDGTNDVLKINRMNHETGQMVNVIYDIQIFNRYGGLVFEADNLTTSEVWDGTWKGDNAPDGTYFYNMSMEIEGEESKFKKGWIQLIRY